MIKKINAQTETGKKEFKKVQNPATSTPAVPVEEVEENLAKEFDEALKKELSTTSSTKEQTEVQPVKKVNTPDLSTINPNPRQSNYDKIALLGDSEVIRKFKSKCKLAGFKISVVLNELLIAYNNMP